MANDVSFSIKVNGTQATTTTNKVRQQFYSLNDVINQTGKNITQVNQQLSTVDKTMKRPTAYDTVGRTDNAINKFGRTIKSLRVHGIDPATNSVARFVNVVGGGMFNTVTLTITAIMSLFYALKKVNDVMQDYFRGLSSRASLLFKFSKQRVEDVKSQKKQIQNVIDQLKKMNEKQKLSNIEKNIALSLVQQIKNKWSDVGIQIDKDTGKIKNFNEVQARLNQKTIQQSAEELENMIDFQNSKLDLALSKYTGKTSLWKGGFVGNGNPFDAFDIFRGKNLDTIKPIDLFPAIKDKFINPEELNKIDVNKLIFGNTGEQISFFRQVAKHLIDPDSFQDLEEIINNLLQKQKLQNQRSELVNPFEENKRKATELQQSFSQLSKQVEKTDQKLQQLEKDAQEYHDQQFYDIKSTRGKIDYQKDRFEENEYFIKNFKNQTKAFKDKWGDYVYPDENGNDTTQRISAILKKNDKVQSLYSEFLELDKKYQPEIDRISKRYSVLKDYQNTVSLYDTAAGFRGSPYSRENPEYKIAKEFIENFGAVIEGEWKDLNDKISNERKQAIQKLNLTGNDQKAARMLDEEQTKLNQYRLDVIQYNKALQQLDQAYKDLRDSSNQLTKLYKQEAEQREAALKVMQDEFAELERLVAEEAKVTQQRKSFLTGMGNDVIAQYMRDTGQEYSLRRQQIERQIMQELGVTSLTANQKSIAGRLAYIEQLQSEQQMNDRIDTFRYGVKTNELASKGGWSSSVYVSGRDSIAQQNLKVNQNQLKIQQQIGKLLPQLKKQMNTLNKNLQI